MFASSSAASAGARRRSFFYQLDAEFSAYLGERERALASIGRSVEAGMLDLVWLERCPLLASLRDDPRYAAAHAELGRRAAVVLEAYRAG